MSAHRPSTSEKYHDWKRGRPIDFARDACSLTEWKQDGEDFVLGIHTSGFPVFVPAAQLEGSDEYAESDPYSVAEGMSGDFHQRRIQTTLELVATALGSEAEGARILDVACGQGHITAAVHERFPKAEVSAFDYSISAIAYAHREYPGIDFAVADAYHAPYTRSYFDLVICNNIWEHVGDPLRLLEGLSRVLRSGGHVLISTPSRYRLGNALRVLSGRPVQFMSSLHVTEYSVGQVEEQLRFGGFDVVRRSSRPLKSAPGTPAQKLVRATVASLLRSLTNLVGSHHSWEATVFFLACKRPTGASPTPRESARD